MPIDSVSSVSNPPAPQQAPAPPPPAKPSSGPAPAAPTDKTQLSQESKTPPPLKSGSGADALVKGMQKTFGPGEDKAREAVGAQAAAGLGKPSVPSATGSAPEAKAAGPAPATKAQYLAKLRDPAKPSPGIGKEDYDEHGQVKTGTLFDKVIEGRPRPGSREAWLQERKMGQVYARLRDAKKKGDAAGVAEATRQIAEQRETDAGGHHYAMRTRLPKGMKLPEANEYARRFNAPTRAALKGKGNPPDQKDGYVDMKAPTTLGGTFGWLGKSGGHVTTTRGYVGEGKDQRAWAQNSTIPGEHLLIGHIVRTVEVDPKTGDLYMKTEGTGAGTQGNLFAFERHEANSVVGPPTFRSLDAALIAAYYRDHPDRRPPQ